MNDSFGSSLQRKRNHDKSFIANSLPILFDSLHCRHKQEEVGTQKTCERAFSSPEPTILRTGLWLGLRALAGPDFLSMCRVFVLPYSPPIRFVTEIWQKVRESWTSSIGPAQRSSPKVAILGFRRKGARPLGKRMGNHNPANLILSTVPRIKALKQIKKL